MRVPSDLWWYYHAGVDGKGDLLKNLVLLRDLQRSTFGVNVSIQTKAIAYLVSYIEG